MKREYLFLILITLLAAGLRFYDLTYQSLWADEASSIYVAKCVDLGFMRASLVDITHKKFFHPDRSPLDLIRACARNESAPPAYFISLAIWIKTFGGGEFAFRSLSAVMGTLTVPAFYLLGLRLFRKSGPALLASLFIAVSPMNVYYSQEARGYSFAGFFSVLSCWLLLCATTKNPRFRAWAAYGLAALIVCYSFYFATIVLFVHLIYLLIYDRSMLKPWLATMAAVGTLYAPWLIIGLKPQLGYTALFAVAGPESAHAFFVAYLRSLRHVFESLVFGPTCSSRIIDGWPGVAVEIGLLSLLTAGWIRARKRAEPRALTFSALIFLAPLAVISILVWLEGTLLFMYPRYHIWETWGICLLAAAFVSTLSKPAAGTSIVAGICALSILALPCHFYPWAYRSLYAKSDYRAAGAIISGGEKRGDLVIVNIAGHMAPLNIYYKGGLRQVGLAETGRYDLTEMLERYARNRRRVWLLLGMDTLGHGDEKITSFLNERFPSKEIHRLRGLDLTLYSGETLDGGAVPEIAKE